MGALPRAISRFLATHIVYLGLAGQRRFAWCRLLTYSTFVFFGPGVPLRKSGRYRLLLMVSVPRLGAAISPWKRWNCWDRRAWASESPSPSWFIGRPLSCYQLNLEGAAEKERGWGGRKRRRELRGSFILYFVETGEPKVANSRSRDHPFHDLLQQRSWLKLSGLLRPSEVVDSFHHILRTSSFVRTAGISYLLLQNVKLGYNADNALKLAF